MIDNDIKAVRSASDHFYSAFESLDIRKMDRVWAQEAYVRCIHPGWEYRIGWSDVRDSWILLFNHTHEIKITPCLLDVAIRGDLAWTVCQEMIATKDQKTWVEGRVLATNLFERKGVDWLLVHHHGSPVLPPQDAEEDISK